MSICNLLLALGMVVALGAPIAQATGGRYQPMGADNPPATSVQRPGYPSAPAHAIGRPRGGTADPRPGDSRSPAVRSAATVSPASRVRLVQSYGRLPPSFEVNRGQTDPRVSFLARGSGYTLFLTATGATLALAQPQAQTAHGTAQLSGSDHLGQRSGATRGAAILPRLHLPVNLDPLRGLAAPHVTEQVVQLRYVGANPHPRTVGVDKLPGVVNYFIGKDPRKWRTNIPTFARVACRNVYPGIDLAYYGHPGQMEYDWAIHPGADPGRIRLAVASASHLSLDRAGNLLIGSGHLVLRQARPVVYQIVAGRQRRVDVHYVVQGRQGVRMVLGAYDHRRALVIDPALSYSTYLGGSDVANGDSSNGIAVNAQGNAYVTGEAGSSNFPVTAGAFQTTPKGVQDVFVTELNPTGSSLIYSTYLGGGNVDQGRSVAIDSGGDAYVTGFTASNNFPVTVGAVQTSPTGSSNTFVTELIPGGGSLVYSTYLGGGNLDSGTGIALDGRGAAYVTGLTTSSYFPTTAGALAGYPNAFVAKLAIGGVTMPPAGAIPWHPRYDARFADGLSASVDLADGHVDLRADDASIAARGTELSLAHIWDSARALAGLATWAGSGWTTDLTPSVAGAAGQAVAYTDRDGTIWTFTPSGSTYASPPGLPWQLSTANPSYPYVLSNVLTGEQLRFNAQGQLVADVDAYNNANTLTYSGATPTAYFNSGGRSLSLSYQNGQLADVQSPLWRAYNGTNGGQHVTYTYGNGANPSCTGGAQLCALTLGAGTTDAITETFGYAGNLLTSVTTGAGHQWALGYDSRGRLATITSPISGTIGQAGYTPASQTQISYGAGQTTVVRGVAAVNGAFTDYTAALTTIYTLDAQGEATKVQDGAGDVTQYQYDADHDVTRLTDANGNVTTSSYLYVGPSNGAGIGSTGLISQTIGPPVGVNSISAPTVVQVETDYTYDASNDLVKLVRTSHNNGGGLGDRETLCAYDSHHGLLTTAELLGTTSSGGSGCPNLVEEPGGQRAAVQLGAVQPATCTMTYTWQGDLGQWEHHRHAVRPPGAAEGHPPAIGHPLQRDASAADEHYHL